MKREPTLDLIADVLTETAMPTHRGAFRRKDVIYAFGNDGYDAESGRVRREVELLKERVTEREWTVAGFGKSYDGYTWVLALIPPAELSPDEPYEDDMATNVIEEVLAGCWREACQEHAREKAAAR